MLDMKGFLQQPAHGLFIFGLQLLGEKSYHRSKYHNK